MELLIEHLCGITHTHTLKRAVSVLDFMKSVVVSVARDGMKSVAVSAARDGMKSVAVCRAVMGWSVQVAVKRC
jgi:hypothetical protein